MLLRQKFNWKMFQKMAPSLTAKLVFASAISSGKCQGIESVNFFFLLILNTFVKIRLRLEKSDNSEEADQETKLTRQAYQRSLISVTAR